MLTRASDYQTVINEKHANNVVLSVCPNVPRFGFHVTLFGFMNPPHPSTTANYRSTLRIWSPVINTGRSSSPAHDRRGGGGRSHTGDVTAALSVSLKSSGQRPWTSADAPSRPVACGPTVLFRPRHPAALRRRRPGHLWASSRGPAPRRFSWFPRRPSAEAAAPVGGWFPAETRFAPDKPGGSPRERGGGRGEGE